ASRQLQREEALQLRAAARVAERTPGDRVEAGVPQPLPRILPAIWHREALLCDPAQLERAPAFRVDEGSPLLRGCVQEALQLPAVSAPDLPGRHGSALAGRDRLPPASDREATAQCPRAPGGGLGSGLARTRASAPSRRRRARARVDSLRHRDPGRRLPLLLLR